MRAGPGSHLVMWECSDLAASPIFGAVPRSWRGPLAEVLVCQWHSAMVQDVHGRAVWAGRGEYTSATLALHRHVVQVEQNACQVPHPRSSSTGLAGTGALQVKLAWCQWPARCFRQIHFQSQPGHCLTTAGWHLKDGHSEASRTASTHDYIAFIYHISYYIIISLYISHIMVII